MAEARYRFAPPKNTALRWLTDPGRHVPAHIGTILLGEIFASPKAVIAGVVNGLILNVFALAMHTGGVFALFILVDLALAAIRTAVLRRTAMATRAGLPIPTDAYLLTALAWCALQGAMAFTAMRTNVLPLQLLTATTAMGLVGPICARNYAAPRYALALVMLCQMPFVAGAALSGDHWLLILILQNPLFLFGIVKIIERFQSMAVATLQAEQDSYERARHDALTGLLNRFGLMEQYDLQRSAGTRPFTLFYLDLDGFKPINDTFGHQAGDKILQAVATRLRSRIRPGDILSRLGGDEFVIFAPDMLPQDGSDYADAIIREVANETYRLDGIEPLRIGISIGFACAPEDGLEGEDLHRKADDALYQAKAAGRGVQRRYRNSNGEDAGLPVLRAQNAQSHPKAA